MIQKTVGFIFHILIFFLIINSHGAQASNNNNKRITNVGVILDFDSQIAKDQRLAMEVSAQSFNNYSNTHKLFLDFQDSQRDSLKAASTAEHMIKEKKAEAIIVANAWQEAALVGKIGNRTQIPILSLSSPIIAPQDFRIRWPFLATMSSNESAEINCITDLALSYKWRKIVAIYEEDNGDFGSSETSSSLLLLNEALEKIGSEIEYSLVLPPYSSISEPKGFVLNELTKLLRVQSRAFIVLRASLPMMSHLFSGAKNLGLMEIDSAWIITETVTNLLDHVDDSVAQSMKGTLGIKTHYSNKSSIYKDFLSHFGRENPGIYALRAYDSVQVIAQAMEDKSGKILLENIISASFDGLSGKISFREGMLVNSNPIFQIVNVVGSERVSYKRMDYWVQEYGFFESLDKIGERSGSENGLLSGSVVWPGNLLNRSPKGWAMPSVAKPLRIGVPGRTQFRKFVTVDESKKYSNEGFDGLCIRVFNMVLKELDYHLSYQFIAFDGTYDELVEAVYNKTFDAAVGDITILSSRSKYVDFTQPYLESGLSMVTPIKSKESGMIFLKPFTWGVWAVTCCILIYTMIVVWFLEHPTNPEFSGTLKNQIGTTLWFTFSSLFFAQRERIHSNVTKVTVAIWLVLVFVVTASYTANLSSMLTVRQLEPQISIEWLRSTDQQIGCDGDSFIRRYLKDVLGFKAENIHDVDSEYTYDEWFAKRNITAAFLEQPYEKVLLNEYCNKFTAKARSYRFGGLGFAFQKGSPLVKDMSKAILKLSENGNITALEEQCLTPNDCSRSNVQIGDTESLSIKSFWGIYVISGVTSTICFMISLVRLRQHFRLQRQIVDGGGMEQPVKDKVIELARYFYNGNSGPTSIRRSTTTGRVLPKHDEWSFSRWKSLSTSDVKDHDSDDNLPPAQIEIAVQTTNN